MGAARARRFAMARTRLSSPVSSRARLAALALSLLLLPALAAAAWAGAPLQGTQAPGYYRMQLGAFEITALHDGDVQIDAALLKNTNPKELDRLLGRMFVDNPKMHTAVNAYLINTGSSLVLVDTGAGAHMGAAMGRLPENLRAAGYDPAQVDLVGLTHMHLDHLGGLTGKDGSRLFPKAKVMVDKVEQDFWLTTTPPAGPYGPFFDAARNLSKPYREAGTWETIAPGQALVPGITAVATRGHTPGHLAYLVESQGQRLLIWGDLVHAHAVQFARPGVTIEFDVDQPQAAATRAKVFKEAAAGWTLVAGMHLPFPGIGHVRAEGKGAYAFVPVEFAPMP
jgi:glyoxylase-like metal-dependent hydrolase (beta-lactamase superfamily II)